MSLVTRERVLEAVLELSGRAAPRTRPELLEKLLHCAMLLVEGHGAAVTLGHTRKLERFAVRRGSGLDPFEHRAEVTELLRQVAAHGHPVPVTDLSTDTRAGETDRCPGVEAGPALLVPFRPRENELGYLGVYRRGGAPPFTSEDVRWLALLTAWGIAALENLRLAESVERLAVTDDLTRIYNYRFLKTALRREIKRAGRFKQDLSIVMIDVDNLKQYNDRHGHVRGSALLREMARLLALQVRSWDLVAKYGGDEFTIILPQTGEEGALVAAERSRAAVEAHTFPLTTRGQISVSLGVACFPRDGTTAAELLQVSDRALYRAKGLGRNRVEKPIRDAAA